MKKWLFASGFAYVSTLFAASDDWSMNNHWTFYGDWVWMGRKSKMLHDKTIIRKSDFHDERSEMTPKERSEASTEVKLGTEHLLNKMGQERGFRVGAVYLQCRWSIEGSYMWINEWKAKSDVYGDRDLSYPFKKSNDYELRHAFFGADSAYGTYKSQFWTADLNYWRHVTPRRMDYFSFSWIAGARYVVLDEKTEAVFKKHEHHDHPERRSVYAIETKNHLLGPQLGLNIQVNPYRQWSWDFTGKIGGLVNGDQQKASIRENNEKLRGGTSHDYCIALFLDLSAMLTWHFWRHADFHIGYEVIYMSGVALAPERYKRTGSNHAIKTVKAIGEICLYDAFGGVSLGF